MPEPLASGAAGARVILNMPLQSPCENASTAASFLLTRSNCVILLKSDVKLIIINLIVNGSVTNCG